MLTDTRLWKTTMPKSQSPSERRPLKPAVFRILLALGDEDLHGYAIMRSLSDKSEGRERILPGTLYATLARMVDEGLVGELAPPEGEASGGPQRRYYRRTDLGRTAAQAESERLRALLEIAAAQNLLPGISR